MTQITKTYGLGALYAEFTKYGNTARKSTKRKVIVGFSAPYAAAVHEAVDMVLEGEPRPSGLGVYWGPHGEAKFLEKPARTHKKQIGRRIAQVTKSTHSVTRGMYAGGVALRDAAKLLVPVEHGDLILSAYVVVV